MMRIFYLLMLFVVPFLVLSLPGVPHWLGRTIAASIFISFMTVGTFWYGLSPKSKMILQGGKLSQPQFDRIRPKIERGIRILVVAFGVLFCLTWTLPFALDLVHDSAGEKPVSISGMAAYKSVPLFGLWFLGQTVRLSRDGPSYYLLYSWTPLRVGDTYEFVVLPRSHLILDFHQSGE